MSGQLVELFIQLRDRKKNIYFGDMGEGRMWGEEEDAQLHCRDE